MAVWGAVDPVGGVVDLRKFVVMRSPGLPVVIMLKLEGVVIRLGGIWPETGVTLGGAVDPDSGVVDLRRFVSLEVQDFRSSSC